MILCTETFDSLQHQAYSTASLPRQAKGPCSPRSLEAHGGKLNDMALNDQLVDPAKLSSASPHGGPLADVPSSGLQGLQGLSGSRVIGAAGAPRLNKRDYNTVGYGGGCDNSLRLGETPSSMRLGDIYTSYQTPALLQDQQPLYTDSSCYSDVSNYGGISNDDRSSFYESTSAFYGTPSLRTQPTSKAVTNASSSVTSTAASVVTSSPSTSVSAAIQHPQSLAISKDRNNLGEPIVR